MPNSALLDNIHDVDSLLKNLKKRRTTGNATFTRANLLATTQAGQQLYAEACAEYMKALELLDKWDERACGDQDAKQTNSSERDREEERRCLLLNIAASCIKLESYQAAQIACERVLESFPSDSKALYRLSLCQSACRDYEGALSSLERVMAVSPDDKEIKRRYVEVRAIVDRNRREAIGKNENGETKDKRPLGNNEEELEHESQIANHHRQQEEKERAVAESKCSHPLPKISWLQRRDTMEISMYDERIESEPGGKRCQSRERLIDVEFGAKSVIVRRRSCCKQAAANSEQPEGSIQSVERKSRSDESSVIIAGDIPGKGIKVSESSWCIVAKGELQLYLTKAVEGEHWDIPLLNLSNTITAAV